MTVQSSVTQALRLTTIARGGSLRRLVRSPLALGSMITLAVIVLACVFAGLLTWNEPGYSRLDLVSAPPGPDYLLGGDRAGRDVYARLLFGGRITLIGALIAGTVAAVLGIATGLIAGFRGKVVDAVSSWVSDLVMVLPSIIVLVALFTIIGPNALMTMAVLGVMLAPSFFRLTRNLVIGVKKNLYIDAAKVSGLPDRRIIGGHVLRVVRAPLVIHLALLMGVAIIIQAGLDFVGLGDSNVPTWGGMLQDSFRNIYRAPLQFIWPGLAIGITVGAFLLLGNGIRDALEDGDKPREPRRSRSVRVASAAPTAGQDDVPEPAGVAGDSPASPGDDDRDTILAVERLSVGYPTPEREIKEVVSDVSLRVKKGEILGIVGESGSGKTQTALAILRLLPMDGRITGGRILFEGRDLAQVSERRMVDIRGSKIAYIPQEPMSNLDPSERIGQQMTELVRVKLGLSRKAAKERALDLLRQVNIANPERVYTAFPHEISGGMAQRVLIASAVACDPDLIIADEPTTALDVTVQAEILSILRNLQRDRGLTVVLVTHNFGVVADLCDRVVVMQNGSVVEEASVHDVFRAPRHEYTKMLLGSSLDGRPSRVERTGHLSEEATV